MCCDGLGLFKCKNCESKIKLKKPLTSVQYLTPKIKEEVLRLDKKGELGNYCEIKCPKCEHNKALFKEIQTRSADEPTTIFYRCAKCEHNWKG
ncbi:hypothetical protein NUSPORA_02508 [Nucleospora cyclopteri]